MTDEEAYRIIRTSGELRHLYRNIVSRTAAIRNKAYGKGFSDVTYEECDRTEVAAKHDLGLLDRAICELERLTSGSAPDTKLE
jgi:hypothetical protein